MWKSFPFLGLSDSPEMSDLAGREMDTVEGDICENKDLFLDIGFFFLNDRYIETYS